MRCLLVVADPLRDLEGVALVGYRLRRLYGMACAYRIPEELPAAAEQPWDVVVLDQLGAASRRRVAASIRRRGGAVVLMPTAGYLLDARSETERAGGEDAGLANRFLAWGEQGARTLKDSGALPGESIRVTGCARLDFYREPWIRLLPDRSSVMRETGFADPDAPCVAWTTGAAHRRWMGRSLRRRLTARLRLPRYDLIDLLDERRIFELGGRVVVDLARQRPGWNLLIKVHPCEDTPPYARLAEGLPNVRVVQTTPTWQLLPHVAALVQRSSTTAFEAWMLDKPVLDLEGPRFQVPRREEGVRGNDAVGSSGEALALCDGYLAGSGLRPEQAAARRAALRGVFGELDGRASERCADAIAEAAGRRPSVGVAHGTADLDDLEDGGSLGGSVARLHRRFADVLSAGEPELASASTREPAR